MCAERSHSEAHSPVPFSEGPPGRAHPDMRRLMEAVLVAVMAGALGAAGSTWATTKVLTVQIEQQRQEIAEIKSDIRQLRTDLYAPLMRPNAMLLSELLEDYKASLNDAQSVFKETDLVRHLRLSIEALFAYKRPVMQTAELNLKPGQTRYQAPSDVLRIERLIWQTTDSQRPWRSTYPGPAPVASLIRMADGDQIHLSPPPNGAAVQALGGRCEMLYRARPEFDTQADPAEYEITHLSDDDRQLVILRAQAEACREMSIRGLMKPVEMRGGGASQPRNGSPRALYDAFLAEWREAQ